ncbi:MAG TPA: transposase [Candidatus Paceibacterota bacterium]|jgi:putative transposase|nr:transposase [Candidatus Paceibacterota bacterium]
MPTRKTLFSIGEYYHIYNRGNAKRTIFLYPEDYKYFVNLLYICNTEEPIIVRELSKDFAPSKLLVDIGAYCLMPNHFHILIKEKAEGGISKFMRKVSTSYVMYFNRKYSLSGSLFEGKFKDRHVNSDQYLKYLYSYIHFNPLKLIDKYWKENAKHNKDKYLSYIKDYAYSSCKSYLAAEEDWVLNKIPFPEYFVSRADYYEELLMWLSYGETP